MFDASQAGRSNPVIKPPGAPATFPTKTFNQATDFQDNARMRYPTTLILAMLAIALASAAWAQTPAIALVANAEGENPVISPNSWVEIKGSNLSKPGDSRIWQGSDFVNNQLPAALDGVSVTIGGKPAYVYYISPTQIDILTPPNTPTGSVAVQVTNNGAVSASFSVNAQTLSPSFFDLNGGPYVLAQHGSDNSLVGPTSFSAPGYAFTPAKPGETVVLYANGFGQTSTAVVGGSETQGGTLSPLPVVTIGGFNAQVSFAGLSSNSLSDARNASILRNVRSSSKSWPFISTRNRPNSSSGIREYSKRLRFSVSATMRSIVFAPLAL